MPRGNGPDIDCGGITDKTPLMTPVQKLLLRERVKIALYDWWADIRAASALPTPWLLASTIVMLSYALGISVTERLMAPEALILLEKTFLGLDLRAKALVLVVTGVLSFAVAPFFESKYFVVVSMLHAFLWSLPLWIYIEAYGLSSALIYLGLFFLPILAAYKALVVQTSHPATRPSAERGGADVPQTLQ
jgi:hypothetical protein